MMKTTKKTWPLVYLVFLCTLGGVASLMGCGGSSGGGSGGGAPGGDDPGNGGDNGDGDGNGGAWLTLGEPIPAGIIQTDIGSRLMADGAGRIYSLSADTASPPRLMAYVYENDEDGWQNLAADNIRLDNKRFNPAAVAGNEGFSLLYHRGADLRDVAIQHYTPTDGWGTPAVVIPSNVSHSKTRAAVAGDQRHLAMMDGDGDLRIWSMSGTDAPGTPINGPANINSMNWDIAAAGSELVLAWRSGSPAQLRVSAWDGSDWVNRESLAAPDSPVAVALAATEDNAYLLRSTGGWAQGSELSASITVISEDGGTPTVLPFTESIHTLPYYEVHMDSQQRPWVFWVEYGDDPFVDGRARLYVAYFDAGWQLIGDGKVVPYDDSIPGAVSSAIINDVPYVQFRDGGTNLRVMYYQE